MELEHRFETRLAWDGSTAGGYRAYSRTHRAVTPPGAQEVALSSARAFHGDPALTNPEQLLVLAASSCQLLSFLAVATRVGLDVRGYTDEATGTMAHSIGPMSVEAIALRPHVVLGPGSDPSVVEGLMQQAHEECFIANSLRSAITVEASVEVLAS